MTNDEQPKGDPTEPVEVLPGDKPEDSSLQDDPKDTPSGDAPPAKKDPLDEIQDPAALRSEAKKFRSIAQRHGKDNKPSEDTPPTPQGPADKPQALPSDVVTTRDLNRRNSKTAVNAARAADADVDANWDAIRPFYVNKRGQETPEDIQEDIKDAVTLWRSRKPADKPADPAAELQTTVQAPPSAKPAPTPEGRQTKSLRQKPASMKDWYQKKEE